MKYKLLIALFLAVFTLNAQERTEEEARDFFGEAMTNIKKPMKFQKNGKMNLL